MYRSITSEALSSLLPHTSMKCGRMAMGEVFSWITGNTSLSKQLPKPNTIKMPKRSSRSGTLVFRRQTALTSPNELCSAGRQVCLPRLLKEGAFLVLAVWPFLYEPTSPQPSEKWTCPAPPHWLPPSARHPRGSGMLLPLHGWDSP